MAKVQYTAVDICKMHAAALQAAVDGCKIAVATLNEANETLARNPDSPSASYNRNGALEGLVMAQRLLELYVISEQSPEFESRISAWAEWAKRPDAV